MLILFDVVKKKLFFLENQSLLNHATGIQQSLEIIWSRLLNKAMIRENKSIYQHKHLSSGADGSTRPRSGRTRAFLER